MKTIRVYVDTSVFGGVFDQEFKNQSTRFFEQVKTDQFILVTSALVQAEILEAPQEVQGLFDELLPFAEIVETTEEALRLRDAYIEAGIVSEKYSNDALHVALATVSNCSVIVSWNFKHIVHFEKIPLYNAINVLQGFHQVSIFSPLEVIKYE
ncbi:hypothetical protein A2V82_01865 [candidate division KSB1 bacterium RBG_16_48_16]|nr:MAG: hypothetical protein A2V82_01865 [candidate division KSB1 bacterium RBG_16_48_16]